MQISLFLKLKNKIDNDEFLKQELNSLFGEENLSQVLLSLTDEQLIDILDNIKNNKEVLYLIYMYVKGKNIPEDIKKLINEKLALEPSALDIVCEMFYIFNQEKLLEREDLKEIVELIINAPQEKAKTIINVFKEVDLSQRDNVVDFIRIILRTKEDYQVQYASQTYAATMKEIAHIESKYEENLARFRRNERSYSKEITVNELNLESIKQIKNNILKIIEIIAKANAVYKSKLISELVTEEIEVASNNYDGYYHRTIIASLSNVVAVSNVLASSKGESQASKVIEFYKHAAYVCWNYKKDDLPEVNPNMKLEFLDMLAKAKGSIQVAVVSEYLTGHCLDLTCKDSIKIGLDGKSFEETEHFNNAKVIADWEDGEQVMLLSNCIGYDTSKWNAYAGKISLLEKLSKKYGEYVTSYIVSRCLDKGSNEIIEMLLNIEDEKVREFIGDSIIELANFNDTKYYLRYIEALLKAKDKLTLCLILVHMIGITKIYNLESDNPVIKQFFMGKMEVLMNENQVRIIINILKETGLGFITDLDDEESIQRVERMANSEEPIEVTLKSLMGLPLDMVEDVLSGQAQEEVELDSKILLFRNTSK